MDLIEEELEQIKTEIHRLEEKGLLRLRDNYNGIGQNGPLTGRAHYEREAIREYFTFPNQEIPCLKNEGMGVEIYWENLLHYALVHMEGASDETVIHAVYQYAGRNTSAILYQILRSKLEIFRTQTEKCLVLHRDMYPGFGTVAKPEVIALVTISQYEQTLRSNELSMEVLSHVSLGGVLERPFMRAVLKILKDYLWQMDPKTYVHYGRRVEHGDNVLPAAQKLTITKPVEELGYLLHLLHEKGYFKRGTTKKKVVDAFQSILLTENSNDLKSLLSYTSPSKSRGNTQERVKDMLIGMINQIREENS